MLDHARFEGKPAGGLYLGVELEIEVNHDKRIERKAEQWDSLLNGRGILKHDGSIHHGFEIVTAPWSLELQQEFWARQDIAEGFRGVTSWRSGRCGLHVHVSKLPLSKYALAKIQVFIHSPATKSYLVALAGRDEERWAKFVPKKLADCPQINGNRYEAINLQNEYTVEFRLFRGTTNTKHILADIEFVDALCRWATTTSARYCEDWGNFWAYVQKHVAKYPNLVEYGENHGLNPSGGRESTPTLED